MGCGVEVGETLETRPFRKPGWVYQSRWATLKLQTPWPLGKLILIQSACWNPSGCPSSPRFLPALHSAWRGRDQGHTEAGSESEGKFPLWLLSL